MRRMMQGREKTRENQFVQLNTVPVASVVLMNFYLFLSFSLCCSPVRVRPFLSLPLSNPSAPKTADFPRRWMLFVEYDATRGRAKNESGKVGGLLKKYQLNTTDVAPITRDASYFASVTRRNDFCSRWESFSCANTAKSVTDSSRSSACFMKTFLAENFLGVRKGRGEGRETREREREMLAQEVLKLA